MTVVLVGAGPGSPDLLTLRAVRWLEVADVVVHDRLVSADILALIPAHVERIDVGKVPGASTDQALINDLLVSLAHQYSHVVRLKGGDPFVFGRGGEEALALQSAGIEVEVVPGISSSFSAPLAAGIPVTHRGLAQGVLVITGHLREGVEWNLCSIAANDITLVVLMGVATRARLKAQLLAQNVPDATPVAVIESAWTTSQRVTRASLRDLDMLDIANPAVMVIGRVAALDVTALSATLAASGVS
jgi:uroporphyrin-III C-methyltransferase